MVVRPTGLVHAVGVAPVSFPDQFLNSIYKLLYYLLHNIYTISTQYLLDIYTISTQYLHSDEFLYACSAASYFRNEYKLGNKIWLQVTIIKSLGWSSFRIA